MDFNYFDTILIGLGFGLLMVCLIIMWRRYSSLRDQNASYLSTTQRILAENSLFKQMLGIKEDDNSETNAPAHDLSEKAASDNDIPDKDTGDKKEESDNSNRYQSFLLATLHKMNCKPEIGDDDKIYFRYQGESFAALQNDSFMRIWDLPFMQVNVLDTNLPLIIEIINSVNHNFGPTIVICNADENGERNIMSRYDIVFHPDLSHPEDYLEHIFSFFFSTKNSLASELKQLEPSEKKEASTPAIYSYALNYQN